MGVVQPVTSPSLRDAANHPSADTDATEKPFTILIEKGAQPFLLLLVAVEELCSGACARHAAPSSPNTLCMRPGLYCMSANNSSLRAAFAGASHEGLGHDSLDQEAVYEISLDPEDRTAVFDLALKDDSDDGGLWTGKRMRVCPFAAPNMLPGCVSHTCVCLASQGCSSQQSACQSCL